MTLDCRGSEQCTAATVGARRLSIAPVVARDPHCNVAVVLLVGLDCALDLRVDGPGGMDRVSGTTVLLSPNTLHAIRRTPGLMAWVHLDAARDDEARIRALMRRDLGASAADHVHDAYVRSAIVDFARNQLGVEELDRALSIALGLSVARPTDALVAQAIAWLRETPGEENRLADIAARAAWPRRVSGAVSSPRRG